MKHKKGYFAIATIFVIVLWGLGLYLSSNAETTLLSSLEPLFSGLAIIGLIATILIQQEELKHNTGALLAQKEEMSRQWEEMEEQNRNMKRQRFESTLFNMWNLHFESRNLIELREKLGIMAFKEFVDEVIGLAYSKGNMHSLNIYTSKLFDSVPIVDRATHFLTIMEPYLNSLKLIFNSIKQAKLNDGAEDRYIEIMKSYLTNFEVMFIVLHYNHLRVLGSEKILTEMYNELEIGQSFVFRVERSYGYKLIADSGIH
jgi:hypothetical protein